MSLYKKKLFLTLSFLAVIAVVFWTGSRYPQLDSKAMMGVDSPTMGISFDVVKQVESDHSSLEKITFNTLNWMDTNKKGMTFGFLFGSAFILLFSLLKDIQIKNRFLNAAIGTIIGAPLGVCVNCAAPIAKGMKDAGAKTETALATMISSPTLNVIVLSMLFAFLPPYMVWLKIGFTLLLIFGVIPVVSHFFKDKKSVLAAPKSNVIPEFNLGADYSDKLVSSNWGSAISWTGRSYFKSLWFIVKTTLPLMILAGFLGNVFITFLPLEKLVDLVQNLSLIEKGLYMLGIAVFATFLPVPIAFDVIIVAILWSTGLHSRFAMVLLFCLGTFSIYSSFIVAKSFSFKLSIALFFITAGFGFAAGIAGHFLEREFGQNYRLSQYQNLKESNSKPNYLEYNTLLDRGADYEELKKMITPISTKGQQVFVSDSLEISRFPFRSKDMEMENGFDKVEGDKKGLVVPYHFSVNEIHDPFANQRSIATGDIHNDGYPDFLIVSAEDIFLYANIGGEEFKHQFLPSFKAKSAFNAALVDFNNDGWKDIFVSTFRNGNYILKNDSGQFSEKGMIKLPQFQNSILTIAPAFGDLNQDGLIDIVLGNWSLGVLGAADYSMLASKNTWLKNEGEFNFELNDLEGIDGETLSILIADYTDDGQSDLIVANDYNVPDHYYVSSTENGKMEWIKDAEKVVERSTLTTMSVVSADVNNDLISEIFQVQIDRLHPARKETDPKEICSLIENAQERENCEELLELQQTYVRAVATRNFELCPEELIHDCIAAEMIRAKAKGLYVEENCTVFPEGWERYQFICKLIEENHTAYPRVKDGSYEHKMQGGLLLMKDSLGYFRDQTENYKITTTGWAWNSKFFDSDNDGWQDLFIANGFLLQASQESNIFYKNIEGKTFVDKTDEFGLSNYLPTSSYSYVDYDKDGDLDIVVVPSIGPVFMHENNFHKNNSISFSMRDQKGNLNGIGATITIYYGKGKHQKRELVLSGGFKSFDEPTAHFGLGQYQKISRLKINWSTGGETLINQELQAGYGYELIRRNFQESDEINSSSSSL